MPITQLSPPELKAKIENQEPVFLLDVREPFEFAYSRIADSTLIPLNQIPGRLQELATDQEIVVICHHGVRSMQAANFLAQVGFEKVSNLVGGIDAWSIECDSSMPRY
jgi:rhodanese-related sulfurtransferase